MTKAPMVLDAEAVRDRLPDPPDVRTALRQAFLDLARGQASQPAQTVLPLGDGASDVIVYPAAVASSALAGVKLSPYLASRPAGQRVSAWTVLLSTQTGLPVLLCDSLALTTERTAGTTAVAVDALAPPEAKVVAVVGSGPVALAHLRHLAPLRSWSSIRVSSPALSSGDPGRVAAIQALPFPVEIADSVTAAVDEADVVSLCTSAAEPVVSLADCRDDVLVTSVSTNAPGAHELAPDDIALCAVYVDYRTGAPISAAELRPLLQDHPDLVVADLPELIDGTAPQRPVGPAFFRSVGLGIEDIAIASLLLETP